MILRFIKLGAVQRPLHFNFASAAASAVDYYSLLGVERGSTSKQIEEAFRKLTRNVTPDSNSALFNRLTQAFVILSDGKARDAYDSLLKVRKFSYINEPTTKPISPSYIADRKAERNKQYQKTYNLDKFGRYRGGVPRPNSEKRGRSLGQTSTLYHQNDSIDVDHDPEYSKVDSAKAESFKNFHQDERSNRTAKRTWKTFEIDYDFFSIRRFLDRFTVLKYVIFFTFVVPTLLNYFAGLKKRAAFYLEDLKKKEKEEKARKHAEEKERLEQEKLRKEQEEEAKKAAEAQSAVALTAESESK